MRIGVALVTHNAAPWLSDLLSSIAGQTRPADVLAVVDDESTDGSMEILNDHRDALPELRIASGANAGRDPITRIARNFTQAVGMLSDCDVVALTDHDDVWFSDRLDHQEAMIQDDPNIWLLASNAGLDGRRGSVQQEFGVPRSFANLPPAPALRWVLRHSVATGGASMIRPEFFGAPPPGWLHDRWWSLVAASAATLVVDSHEVIAYRIHAEQQVGLDGGRQQHTGIRRVTVGRAGDLRRLADLHGLQRGASPACRGELSYPRLIRTLLASP